MSNLRYVSHVRNGCAIDKRTKMHCKSIKKVSLNRIMLRYVLIRSGSGLIQESTQGETVTIATWIAAGDLKRNHKVKHSAQS